MENISNGSSDHPEDSREESKLVSTREILIDYHEEAEGEFEYDHDNQDGFGDSHFYPLLALFDVINGFFRKKEQKREAFEKILHFSEVNKLQDKNLSLQRVLVSKNEADSVQSYREEAETSNLSKIHDFNKTISYNHDPKEEIKNPEEVTMKDPFDTDSKSPILTPDNYLSDIEKNRDEILRNFESKISPQLEAREVQTEFNNYLLPLRDGAHKSAQAYPGEFSSQKCIQVDSKHFDEIDTKILSHKLSEELPKSPFYKIFVLLDEVAHKVPDLSQFLLKIRRELEVEIGAFELAKQEVESKRKELQQKADVILDLECANLENSVYLNNKIQELNTRIAELYDREENKSIEVCHADIQTDLTAQKIQETELDLLASKQNIEIDILSLNERIKEKEKQFKFNYESQKKEIELLRQEVENENKILISKKKQLLLSPFNELQSDAKLRDLVYHFKKANIQDIKAPEIDIEFEAYLRTEMFQISTLEDIDKLRATADRVVKLEYILLKEKSKMSIVSQYVDAAIQELECEKEEYRVMRQKYENLLVTERDLQKYKREQDEKNNKFQSIIVDYRDKISKIFDCFQEIMQIKRELPLDSKIAYALSPASSIKMSAEKIRKHYSQSGFHENLIKALEDIDIIIDIQKVLIKDVPNCDEHTLLKSMKDQWSAHQQSALSNQSLLAITNKKVEKMEWIKRVLDTESKFIEEEKRWIQKERQAILDQKARGEKGNFIGTFNSDSFDFMTSSVKRPSGFFNESDANKTKDKLEVEVEVMERLNSEIRAELDRINDEKVILIDKEENIQKERLNILLQYDSIKKLEQFYNEYHPVEKHIQIEGIDVNSENMREMFQKYLKVAGKSPQKFYDTKDRQMLMVFALHKMMYCLWHVASYNQYSYKDLLLIYFNLWRTKNKVDKQIKTRELLLVKMNSEPAQDNTRYQNSSEDTWFEIFWDKNKSRVLSQHVISDKRRSIHEEHLFVERKKIEREMKKYWKFKSQKALKMIFLHLRRKLRYILAYSFMKYRINVLLIARNRSKTKPRFLSLKK
ncbi:unnamed protein product [Moneuplotes crassus]|uniref:Uncharacterized protein n=1 Tax=Euplotes crassus TaxID=5936 RepID=A0AAD1XTS8_EUPCR|nr:unnamed protein product [Moneuplotes crassus]